MKKPLSEAPYQPPRYPNDRRTGNTTRRIDSLVQELFTDGYVQLGYNNHNKDHVFNLLVRRLHSEHEHLFASKEIIVNKGNLSIELKNGL